MAVQPTPDVSNQNLFAAAAADLMAMLREQLGYRLWIVARVKGDEWLVMLTEGQAYGIRAGHTFRWQDTFCSRMAAGLAPRFAANAQSIEQYAAAPFGAEFRIASYIGVPLATPDGRLLGTLCAFDTTAQKVTTAADQKMVETCAQVLARIMHAEGRTSRQSRRLERTEALALCDALSGLYNRRGWDQLLKAEESRCRRHGRSACVVSIDLDDLKTVNDTGGHEKGDELIRKAGNAVRQTIRTQDIAARVGGDEFVVLAVECDAAAMGALKARLEAGLTKEGIRASIGVALRTATSDLLRTWREADEAMYQDKRERKSAGGVKIVKRR